MKALVSFLFHFEAADVSNLYENFHLNFSFNNKLQRMLFLAEKGCFQYKKASPYQTLVEQKTLKEFPRGSLYTISFSFFFIIITSRSVLAMGIW